MPINEFAVTAAMIQARALPHYTLDANSHPSSTVVADLITARAGEISGLIQRFGITPTDIDATGEPIAYRNCQRLLVAGVALDVALAFTGRAAPDGLVEGWRKEWDRGVRMLSKPQEAKAFLVDALSSARSGFIRTHVQDVGSLPTLASDLDIDDPVFVRNMDL